MRRTAPTLALAVLALTAVGCSATRHQASLGMVSPEGQVLTLGAGDTLGRAVYVNDLILAAAALDHDTMYTNVDTNGPELLFTDR